jgi:16S rRNA (uracil1498-N3)-methyltransferase
MALKSVYLSAPLFENGTLRISDEEHRHLAVSRTEPAEILEVFDGRGNVWTVRVTETGRHETVAQLERLRRVDPPSFDLLLGQALIRPSAFETMLEKAVEVGVTRIIPFVAAHSNFTRADRQDRWNRVIIEAAKQSKRYHLPALEQPVLFEQILNVSARSKVVFTERDGGPLSPALSGSPVLYLIGPEGGWTSDELKLARAAGFHAVSLGSGILKSDTAAIVGAALIRYELKGD